MFELIQALHLDGDRARGRAHVPADLPQLADHFPGQVLVPGTLLIELMAQVGGPLAEEACAEPRWAVLGLVRNASFPAPTPAGVTLELTAELVRSEPSRAVVRGQASVGGEARARAELVFSLQEADPSWAAAVEARDARVARWLAAWEAR